MKVVDHIESSEQVEKLTGEQRDDLFTQLLTGKDVIETINTSRGDFQVKYPKVGDIITIGKIAAYRCGGKLDTDTEMLNVFAATLDTIVVSGPKWFEDAKAKNKNFSFLEVPSRVFLMELYGKAYTFREEIEQRLNPPEGSTDKSIPAEAGNDGAVGGGAFTGLSGQPGDTET